MQKTKNLMFCIGIAALSCLTLEACSDKAGDDQIRNYIAAHPEEIVSSVLKYREQVRLQYRKTQRSALRKAVAELSTGNNVVINPDGRTEVTEILDYNCGYCKAAFADIERRTSREWKDVKFTLVPLPIIGERSRLAVLATRSAVVDGQKPAAFMKALLEKPVVDDEAAREVAAAYSIKLDDAHRFSDPVSRDMKMMERLEIKATPTFIVGGEILTGYRPDELAALIAKAAQVEAP